MHEEVPLGLEGQRTARDYMRRPDAGRMVRSVTGQRGIAPESQPIGRQECVAAADVKHHLVVIAQQRHQPRLFAQRDKQFQHAADVRPAVGVVAQGDDRVVAARV